MVRHASSLNSRCFIDPCLFLLGAIFIFISAASPNRASLGATNGLSQVSNFVYHSNSSSIIKLNRCQSALCALLDQPQPTRYSRYPSRRTILEGTLCTMSSLPSSAFLLLLDRCFQVRFGRTYSNLSGCIQIRAVSVLRMVEVFSTVNGEHYCIPLN